MQLDDLLQRYFATTDLSGVAPDTFAAGIEHCRVDLGLEKDRGKRFALWSFLHLRVRPSLDVTLEQENRKRPQLHGSPGGMEGVEQADYGVWHLQTRTRYPSGLFATVWIRSAEDGNPFLSGRVAAAPAHHRHEQVSLGASLPRCALPCPASSGCSQARIVSV